METKDMLFEDIFTFLKNNYRGIGVVGTLIGAFQAIFYCSSINYYPSGMTIADTLFFLWVFVVSGIIYSTIVFILFRASILWITIIPEKYAERLFKKIVKTDKFNISPVKNKITIGGIICNIIILIYLIATCSFAKIYLTVLIFIAMMIGYYMLTVIVEKTDSRIILDEKEHRKPMPSATKSNIRLAALALIYFSPLLVGHFYLAEGISKETFQIMGVKMVNTSILIENGAIREVLDQLKKEKLAIKSSECGKDNCIVKNATILFTGIGSSTKLEISNYASSIELIIPNSAIKCIFKSKLTKQKI